MAKPKLHCITTANPNLLLEHSIMLGKKGDECRPITYPERRTMLEWQRSIHVATKSQKPDNNLSDKLTLIHQLISECAEHVRNLDKLSSSTVNDEQVKQNAGTAIANAIIGLLNVAASLKLDIESVIYEQRQSDASGLQAK